MTRKLNGTYIQSGSITTTQLSSVVTDQIAAGGGPRVTSLSYPGNDTAANTVGGQTVYIVGSGFETNNAIYINGNAVPSKSFISASNLSFTTPALSAGLYPVYVINTDTGATAIFVPGLSTSEEPSWVTSAGSLSSSQDEASAWSYSLSATGDAPITYALASGSSLPTGVSLASNGVISGTISSPPGTETTYTFSVVASDAQNQDSTRQFTVTTTSGEGVLFANNVLLIHADGTNNKNNHTFIDSSNNNFTITRNGNATQGTFSPFSQTGWSNYFDGTGDYLSISSNAALTPGTGDYTFEAWIYGLNFGATSNTFYGASATNGILFSINNGTSIIVNKSGTGPSNNVAGATQNYTFSTHRWYHVAFTRQSQNTRIFVNGTQVGSTTTDPTDYAQTAATIGSNGTDQYWSGYISNLRFIKGTALYTSNFTPSTTPLTAVSNTSILTCQSNRFIDNSNNAFGLTRNGDVSVQPFSPFAPTATYTTANVGGSVYLDGNDSLSWSGSTIGTNPFTLEAWVYFNAISASEDYLLDKIADYGNLAVRLTRLSGGVYYIMLEAHNVNSPTFQVPNWVTKQWYHVAVVRNSSNQTTAWVNGVRSSTGVQTITNNYGISSIIGTNLNGYISGFNLNIGSALYDVNSSTISIPTSPPTSTSNTRLLLNYTNAGIFDQTAKNVIETVGDAKISTAQYKYGTASMYFDGSGDYLETQTNQQYLFSTGDFTIESWVRWDASKASSYNVMFDWRPTNTNGVYPMLYVGDSGNVKFYVSSADRITSNAISANTWTHVALVRYSGNTKLYIDGTQSGSTYTDSNSYLQNRVRIGESGYSLSDGLGYKGYLDDIRITKSYARYTANFTAPTAALKDK